VQVGIFYFSSLIFKSQRQNQNLSQSILNF